MAINQTEVQNREIIYTQEELEYFAEIEAEERKDVTTIKSKCNPAKYYPERKGKSFSLKDILTYIQEKKRPFNLLDKHTLVGKTDADKKLKYKYDRVYSQKQPDTVHLHHVLYMDNKEYFDSIEWGYRDVKEFVNALGKAIFTEAYNTSGYNLPDSLGTIYLVTDERKYYGECKDFLEKSIRAIYKPHRNTPTIMSTCYLYLRKQAQLLHAKAVGKTYGI